VNEYDVIVVGGGLGGLTAGALLARRGKRVLLLEQHDIPGGYATCYRRGDLTVEVGLHDIDGMGNAGDYKRAILDEIGAAADLTFVPVPELYRYVNGAVDIVLPDRMDEAIATLSAAFPAEAAGIRRFFAIITAINRAVGRLPRSRTATILLFPILPFLIWPLIKHDSKTVGEALDECVADPNLKKTILANIGYYHDDPYAASMIFFAAAQGSYLSGGGHYVKGGSQRLSDRLARAITDNGGTVKLRRRVTKIVTADGRVTGVRFANPTARGPQGEETAAAPAVVANAPLPLVVHELLDDLPADYLARIDAMEVGPSMTSVYLGFDIDLAELGSKNYITFIDEAEGDVAAMVRVNRADDEGRRKGFAFADYGRIDAGLAPAGKSTGTLSTLDYPAHWESLTPEEYAAKKARTQENLLARLETFLPGIRRHIVYVETGTPKTMVRYTSNPGGAVYGFAQTPGQAGRHRPAATSIPVKGLYIASAWGMPGGGFSGAMIGGLFAANAITGR
jgi:phytoene dehydrogenase-like protein